MLECIKKNLKSSIEYKQFRKYILKDLAVWDLYYYPLSLTDIIEICFNKITTESGTLPIWLVISKTVEYVLGLHYSLHIGLIRSNISDDRSLFNIEFKREKVFGDVDGFIDTHKEYLTDKSFSKLCIFKEL